MSLTNLASSSQQDFMLWNLSGTKLEFAISCNSATDRPVRTCWQTASFTRPHFSKSPLIFAACPGMASISTFLFLPGPCSSSSLLRRRLSRKEPSTESLRCSCTSTPSSSASSSSASSFASSCGASSGTSSGTSSSGAASSSGLTANSAASCASSSFICSSSSAGCSSSSSAGCSSSTCSSSSAIGWLQETAQEESARRRVKCRGPGEVPAAQQRATAAEA
mmetsp:Transcript_95147/g.213085  ORF Transcript_95147/g.213085 Transcript_95147/m.213085 type:complete len:221 (+) Transcript_95147:667-1329(+)